MPDSGHHIFTPRCVRLVRFADLELRDVVGAVQDMPTSQDFFDCLSYFQSEHTAYTGRAQPVDLPFARAAIDIDKPADLELAERILAQRAAQP